MPSNVAVRFDESGAGQEPPESQATAPRRENKIHPAVSASATPPSRDGRMLANIARPPKTAPVTPRLANASARTQQDDAASAPRPMAAPTSAN